MATDSIAAILRDAEKARWSLEVVTTGLVDLDFDKPFLPEGLVEPLAFLTASERTLQHQIRAHGYLGLMVLCEKLALPFLMAEASGSLHRDTDRFLAIMGSAHEAAKHIAAFERFSAAIERGLDVLCEVVGPAEDLSARFLARDMLALGLLVLHFKCLTQTHYLRGARRCQTMDARFKELLRQHWAEEAQSVRLLRLLLAELGEQASPSHRERALADYVQMLKQLTVALGTQAALDCTAFESVARPLDENERRSWHDEQGRSYHEVFVSYGVEHPALREVVAVHFGGSLDDLDEATRRRVTKASPSPMSEAG